MEKSGNKLAMSLWQLGMMILLIGQGSGMVFASNHLIPHAGQQAWLVPLVAAAGYYALTYLMLKLGEMFPNESFPAYCQHIWGKWGAGVLTWLFIFVTILEMCYRLQLFAREVVFFMFDRTPPEVIILTLLGTMAYCAIQDFETVLKVMQIMFFTALPMLVGIILLGFINFQTINIYPLWPLNVIGIGKGVLASRILFLGYESVLFLLPWVNRGNSSITKAVSVAMAMKGLLIAITVLVVIGSQTEAGTKAIPYPTAVAIRGIELPGTFVERIDNYIYLAWLPLLFIVFSLQTFLIANAAAQVHNYNDHRPFVCLLLPILFVGTMSLHDLAIFMLVSQYLHWLGLFFTAAVIPATYLLARWQHRKREVATL